VVVKPLTAVENCPDAILSGTNFAFDDKKSAIVDQYLRQKNCIRRRGQYPDGTGKSRTAAFPEGLRQAPARQQGAAGLKKASRISGSVFLIRTAPPGRSAGPQKRRCDAGPLRVPPYSRQGQLAKVLNDRLLFPVVIQEDIMPKITAAKR
jgi:hypothetical protein